MANELHVPVMIAMRKWIYMRGALEGAAVPAGGVIRTQFDGWEQVHGFDHTAPAAA